MTPFSSKCDILAELWIDYRKDEAFEKFVEFNDFGLPAAFLISAQIVQSTPRAEEFINETFAVLLQSLGIEDSGWTTLEEMLDEALSNS